MTETPTPLDLDAIRERATQGYPFLGLWAACNDALVLVAENERLRAEVRLAVVREHLPVKPDRETVARALAEHRLMGGRCRCGLDPRLDYYRYEQHVTDAVLAEWPGESRAQVQAEALRDAADEAEAVDADALVAGCAAPVSGERGRQSVIDAARAMCEEPWTWLRARADRLAAEGGHAHRLVRADDAEAKVERQRDRLRARERQVRRLRTEVTRLHALVADLRATASPAWDEYAAVEGMARAVYPSLFADDRQPPRGQAHSDAELREGERDVARERMRQALAVVRDYLPVKPSREAVIEAMLGSDIITDDIRAEASAQGTTQREPFLCFADAALSLLPGRSEDEVKAEALREFADAHRFPSDWIMFRRDDGTGVTVSDMLRAVAAHLAAGGGADRG